jgi:hypothetical protein
MLRVARFLVGPFSIQAVFFLTGRIACKETELLIQSRLFPFPPEEPYHSEAGRESNSSGRVLDIVSGHMPISPNPMAKKSEIIPDVLQATDSEETDLETSENEEGFRSGPLPIGNSSTAPAEWQKKAHYTLQDAISYYFKMTLRKVSDAGFEYTVPPDIEQAMRASATSEYVERALVKPDDTCCHPCPTEAESLYPGTQRDAEAWVAHAHKIDVLCRQLKWRANRISELQCELKIYDNQMDTWREYRAHLVKYGMECPELCVCPAIEVARERLYGIKPSDSPERIGQKPLILAQDQASWFNDAEAAELSDLYRKIWPANRANGKIIHGMCGQCLEVFNLEKRSSEVRVAYFMTYEAYIQLQSLLGEEITCDDFPSVCIPKGVPQTIEQLKRWVDEGEALFTRMIHGITPAAVWLVGRISELPTPEQLMDQIPEPPANGDEDAFAGIQRQLDDLAHIRGVIFYDRFPSPPSCGRLPKRSSDGNTSEAVVTKRTADKHHFPFWLRMAVDYLQNMIQLQGDMAKIAK